MRPLLLPLALLLTLSLPVTGCAPTPGDDDDSAGDDDDDDDSTGDDDDDSAGDDDDDDSSGDDDDDDSSGDDDDDDDATGDDDDDSSPATPCSDMPPPPAAWGALGSTVLVEGQGRWPEDTDSMGPWSWYAPDYESVDALFPEFGPLNGGGADVPTAEALKEMFDPGTQDLFVVTYVEQASGECIRPTGVYQNTEVDCICYGIHLHQDRWDIEVGLPAKMHWTVIYVTPDQGNDGQEEPGSLEVIWTVRDIDPPPGM